MTSDQKKDVKMARNWPWSMVPILYCLFYNDVPVLYLKKQLTPDQKRGVKMARNWPRSICQAAFPPHGSSWIDALLAKGNHDPHHPTETTREAIHSPGIMSAGFAALLVA